MPKDSLQLRDDLSTCLPSLVIDRPLTESGQRVVYLARFDDSLIPDDVLPPDGAEGYRPFIGPWPGHADAARGRAGASCAGLQASHFVESAKEE